MELLCSIQNYHWGIKGQNSLVGKFAQANSNISLDENQSYAEFWMGTHPSGSSYIKTTKISLSDYFELHPEDLGAKVTEVFGKKLPFLFKILAVKEPLSIQAHPSKRHAEELFKKHPNIYKDENHKPEIAIAITEFEVLCGFRPKTEIKKFLREVDEFKELIDPKKLNQFLLESDENNSRDHNGLLKNCFESLMTSKEEIVAAAAEKLITRLENLKNRDVYLYNLILRINNIFPKDIGLFCVYWLNYLILSPGEAVYLAPNEPHAYLYGNCIECMSNSDNVVRAGLTPKFRDVTTLCNMLTYKCYQPNEILFSPVIEDEFSQLYSPPIKDFAVVKILLPKNCIYTLKKRESASILLVYDGCGECDSVILEFGKVLLIPSNDTLHIKSKGLVLFQAFCNV